MQPEGFINYPSLPLPLPRTKILSIILLSLSLSLRFDQLSHSLSLSLSNKKEIPTLDASAYISLVISALQFGPSDRQQVKLQQHQRSLEHTTKLT